MRVSKNVYDHHTTFTNSEPRQDIIKKCLGFRVERKKRFFVTHNYKRYNKLVTDVIAVNLKSNEVEIAVRYVENCSPLVSVNLNVFSACGYQYTFKSDNKYYTTYKESPLVEVTSYPVIWTDVEIDDYKWQEDSQLKFLEDYRKDILENSNNICEFVSYLRKEPKIEYLVKSGLTKHFRNTKQLKKFKLTEDRIEMMQEYNLTVAELKCCEHYHIKPKQYAEIKKLRNSLKYGGWSKPFNIYPSIKEIILNHPNKVLNNWKNNLNYIDLLKLAHKLKTEYLPELNLEKYVLVDLNDIDTKHQNLLDLLNQKQAEEREEKLKQEEKELSIKNQKLYKQAHRYNFEGNDTINFEVLDTINKFFITGEELNHCVYKLKYYDKVIQKKALIINALINEKITETLEVDLTKKCIIQCRGKNNLDSQYHNEIMKLASDNIIGVL